MRRCPHCNLEFHEDELTNTVAGFFRNHRFDKDYDPEADDSGVACIGSLTHGPARPKRQHSPLSSWESLGQIEGVSFGFHGGKSPKWVDEALSATAKWTVEFLWEWDIPAWQGSLLNDWFGDLQWKAPCEQKPVVVDESPPKIDVKFGPENWINTEPRQLGYAKRYIPLPKLAEWRAIPLPTFKSKDLSTLADEINAKLNPTYGSIK